MWLHLLGQMSTCIKNKKISQNKTNTVHLRTKKNSSHLFSLNLNRWKNKFAITYIKQFDVHVQKRVYWLLNLPVFKFQRNVVLSFIIVNFFSFQTLKFYLLPIDKRSVLYVLQVSNSQSGRFFWHKVWNTANQWSQKMFGKSKIGPVIKKR